MAFWPSLFVAAALAASAAAAAAAAAAAPVGDAGAPAAPAAAAASGRSGDGTGSVQPPPKLILSVIVDDLGWNNVGWHADPASGENQTPHLHALATEGVRLDRFYTHFTCTPSRSSYMTGRLPVHVQTTLANPDVSTAGIPQNMTALPLKLRQAGWSCATAGKWDLGFSTPQHTPEGRGFDSSLVYAEHMNFYFTQRICPTGTACDMGKYGGLVDLWDTGRGASTLNGTAYIEYLFRDRLMEVVGSHDPAAGPLYLQYTPHVAHWPLQVPQEWYDRFPNVTDDEAACGDKIPYVWPGAPSSVLSCRRQYLSMVALVDEIVGNLTDAIKARGWWNDTLMIFSADNGGSIDPTENAASNFPHRGGKYMPMEGGIRVAAFASGGYLPPAVRGTVLNQPFHMADWYGTLCGLVGVNASDPLAASAGLPQPDSLDMWPLLSGAVATSPRSEIPVSKDVLTHFTPDGAHAWKLIRGRLATGAGWMGPVYPNSSSPQSNPFEVALDCTGGPSGSCLFDVLSDPGEHIDVASSNAALVASMSARLDELAKGFYSNDDAGTSACPPGVADDCMCWLAANKYGGFLGPWQL